MHATPSLGIAIEIRKNIVRSSAILEIEDIQTFKFKQFGRDITEGAC